MQMLPHVMHEKRQYLYFFKIGLEKKNEYNIPWVVQFDVSGRSVISFCHNT